MDVLKGRPASDPLILSDFENAAPARCKAPTASGTGLSEESLGDEDSEQNFEARNAHLCRVWWSNNAISFDFVLLVAEQIDFFVVQNADLVFS